MTTTIIESREGRYYATLADTPEGVTVAVWRWTSVPLAVWRHTKHGPRPVAKRIDDWLLDCPFHIACDAVHDLIWPLSDANRKEITQDVSLHHQ